MQSPAALLLVLFIVSVASTENPGTAAITNAFVQTEHLNAVQANQQKLLRNPALQNFYDQYYRRPQDTLSLQIADLSARLDSNAKLASGHYYPYANQVSVDPNVLHRLVGLEPRRNLVNRVNDELALLERQALTLAAQNEAGAMYGRPLDFRASPTTVSLRDRMQSVDNALHENNLLRSHNHHYSVPFGQQGPMNAVEYKIDKMEHVVQRPLEPLKANAEEVTALNTLSARMEKVGKLIHKRPTEELHQSAHANDMLLEQLANYIRRISNSFKVNRQSYFLNGLHKLLHTFHLHDHKFMNSFEQEIADALAHNRPLSLPRSIPKPIIVEPTKAQAQTQTQTSEMDLNTPVTAKETPITNTVTVPPKPLVEQKIAEEHKLDLNTPVGEVNTITNVQSTPPPNYETTSAQIQSLQMKQYGKQVIERSREMNHRADIAQAHAITPQAEQDELVAAIVQRLNNPPAQVQSL